MTERIQTAPDTPDAPSNRAILAAFVLLFAGYIGLMIRTAWLCDDAYITFRTVDNFTHGLGLTWNAGERVQTYTHPLWMFLLSGLHLLTGEVYFTSLLLSMALSAGVVLVLYLGIARKGAAILPVMAAVIGSKALIEYSTSGLENPLSHFLLVLFAFQWMRGVDDARRLFGLALTGAFIALNRLDLILVVGPALALTLWRSRSWRALGVVAAGFSPVAAWEVFSVFYYGFPFPNTAYAKLGAAIPQGVRLLQGSRYFLNSLFWDPSTLMVSAGAIALPFFKRSHRMMAPLAVGCVLYLFYVLRIGGDFMSGRMLAAPLVTGLAMLAWPGTLELGRRPLALFSVAGLCSLISPYHPINTHVEFTQFEHGRMDEYRIADERSWYYEFTGLLRRNGPEWPSHGLAVQGRADRAAKHGRFVMITKNIGFYGYFAGPDAYVLDLNALSDPLLARMPPVPKGYFHPGHIERQVPAGYFETLEHGRNVIKDRRINRFYQRLQMLTQGPLLVEGRFREIIRLNLRVRTPFEEAVDGI